MVSELPEYLLSLADRALSRGICSDVQCQQCVCFHAHFIGVLSSGGAQTTTNTVCASYSSWGDFHLGYIQTKFWEEAH